jgi:hypothetical protein
VEAIQLRFVALPAGFEFGAVGWFTHERILPGEVA